MNVFTKVAAYIAATNTSRTVTSWGSWFVASWLFDDILYPVVIGWLGPIVGGAIMATSAVILCWIWLKAIIRSNKEWFNMDVLQKIRKIVFWAVRVAGRIPYIKKEWVDAVELALIFLALNIQFDPMITTLYFRQGDTTKMLSKKDIKIFAWSALVSNGYWILRSWGVASVVIYGWNTIVH